MNTRTTPNHGRAPESVDTDARLRLADKYVYQLVARRGADVPISYGEIAEHTRDGPNAASNAIANLVAAGWLEIVEHKARIKGKVRGARYRTRTPGPGDDTANAA